jgi:uncharacterized protein YprB with RNaseH-like and TPR domain/predicted nuclease with RNAse H fold/dephospho-CoA kinase
MLRQTFQHFRGITAKREQQLWAAGALDWQTAHELLSPQRTLFGPADRGTEIARLIGEGNEALERNDAAYFGQRLNRQEHYRIALAMPEKTLFLDIETTGLSRYYDTVTVIGWSLGRDYGFFVKGQDIEFLRHILAQAQVVVTFNGTLFDVPFIMHEYPTLELPRVHVDLRFLARRAGLTGGQKKIEALIGVKREAEVAEMAGEMAPVLWNDYTRGNTDALRTLLRYNAADVRGMKRIFDTVCGTVLRKHGFPIATCPQPLLSSFEHPDRMRALEQEIGRVARPWSTKEPRKLRIDDLVFVDRTPRLRVVGIDLTGSEKRPSGWCLLDGREVATAALAGDEEIVARTVKENPHVISIDSPLSLPDGRTSVFDDDPGRAEFGIMRYCERVLKRRGVNVYPALIPSMQRLTARGIQLATKFRKMGFPVIESYPGAAQDIMGIPRKRKGLEYLEQGLAEFGVSGAFIKEPVSHDELDAITSAIVGVFFWAGQVERLGRDPLDEEALFIPDLRVDAAERRNRLAIGFSGSLGAGKTTAAQYVESLGFTYCRYSQIIEALVRAKNSSFTREDLQIEGERVHEQLGQRWLGRELLRPLLGVSKLVIDGVRFPEDHAFLSEIFGSQFLHVHVVASLSVRRQRYEQREGTDFWAASAHPVEGKADELKVFAREVVENNGSLMDYHSSISTLLSRQWG